MRRPSASHLYWAVLVVVGILALATGWCHRPSPLLPAADGTIATPTFIPAPTMLPMVVLTAGPPTTRTPSPSLVKTATATIGLERFVTPQPVPTQTATPTPEPPTLTPVVTRVERG